MSIRFQARPISNALTTPAGGWWAMSASLFRGQEVERFGYFEKAGQCEAANKKGIQIDSRGMD